MCVTQDGIRNEQRLLRQKFHVGNSFRGLTEQGHQDTCGNGRTDNACHVGAHSVHEQEVGGILLLTNDLPGFVVVVKLLSHVLLL